MNNDKFDPIVTEEELLNIDHMDGYEFEEYTKTLLENLGYTEVEVTKKSGDQGVDVLAIDNDGLKIAVQCKRYSAIVGNKAIQEIYTAKGFYKCDKAIVITTAEFTTSAIELATVLDVELWGRSILKEKIIHAKTNNRDFKTKSETNKLMQELDEFEKIKIRIGLTNLEKEYIESIELKRKRLWELQTILCGQEYGLKLELEFIIKDLNYVAARNLVGKPTFENYYINIVVKKRYRIREIAEELRTKWKEKGHKQCSHDIIKYSSGTTYSICTICGYEGF